VGYSDEFSFRDCPWCGARDSQFRPITLNSKAGRADRGERTWSLLACPRCAGVVVIETNDPSEGPPAIRSIVPEHESGADVEHLPAEVERHYQSARRVLAAGEPDLAAVSLRRTLEEAASQRGIHERVLVASVEKMLEQGLITTEFRSVLDHVRRLGNVGAHAGSPPLDATEVSIAMRFTTQVLRNLFEIPAVLAESASATTGNDA
jgi:hypothetical protein